MSEPFRNYNQCMLKTDLNNTLRTLYSDAHTVIASIIDTVWYKENLSQQLINKLTETLSMEKVSCKVHEQYISHLIVNNFSRAFICAWCTEVNKLLKGKSRISNTCDSVMQQAARMCRKNINKTILPS